MRARLRRECAARFGHLAQGFYAGRELLQPGAVRVHKVALYVEDEFALAPDSRLCELGIERSFDRQIEKAACIACCGVCCVEGK